MNSQIAGGLRQLGISITPKHIVDVAHIVINFELRGQHPLALNSQMLGIHQISFTDADRQALFAVFGIEERKVIRIIQTIPTINQEFKVASDAFNILIVWLMHLGFVSIENHTERDEFMLNLAKLLHYKFFTSLVNYYFTHGANEKVMAATIGNLSKKFDIIVYGTWKKAIEARCRDLIAPDSIHHRNKTFERADNDKYFIYVLSDTQTRLRDRVKNIVAEYYLAKERGDKISDRSSTTEDQSGEKILVHTASTLDSLATNLCTEVLNSRVFINQKTMDLILLRFSNVSPSMLRDALLAISELAVSQVRSKEFDLIKTVDGNELYVGVRVLISNVIQKSYRYCIKNHIDLSDRGAIFLRILNVYSSSRISSPDIIKVKESVTYLIDNIGHTRRETTKASLRLAVILYIIVRSFEYL